MQMPSVVVLGGGVAGMSAAQELAERGFRVRVFEKRDAPGGKARSIPVPDSGVGGRPDLPGEHGFRFFPRFYRHVTDTMKRIPYSGNRNGCFDNLVAADRDMLARSRRRPLVFPARFPRHVGDVECMIRDLFESEDLGLSQADRSFFAERVWQLMTSCQTRIMNEYERISWWTFTDAEARTSRAYRTLLVEGLTRTLVAAKARTASTHSGGIVLAELVYGTARPGRSDDNLLDGPTSRVWLEPWLAHLRELGVDYRLDSEVEAIHCRAGRITGATVRANGRREEVTGDYYVAAVPVEVMATLVTGEMIAADPILANVATLAKDVRWMNGIQFFLRKRAPIVNGHVSYIDSPWALTSISEGQFWKEGLGGYGAGDVEDVLSVDISEWQTHGILRWPQDDPNGCRKTAAECTPEEIRAEVWAQIQQSVDVDGSEPLRDDMLVTWFLDSDISRDPHGRTDAEPLLVNRANTWSLRPTACTRIPNLFLASDYVQTNTSLATMEAANEAARRAVNGIIDASGADVAYCGIWKLYEPWALAPARWHDAWRHARGLPWSPGLAGPFRLVHRLAVAITGILRLLMHRG